MSAVAVCSLVAPSHAQQVTSGFGTTPPGGVQLLDSVTVPATLYCWTEVNYIGYWIQTHETIFSPSSRLMASGGGAGWNSVYHETTEAIDEWSQPGTWTCPASWTAFTGFPGQPVDSNSQTLTVEVINPNCNCRATAHNNALRSQRTGPIGLNAFDPNLAFFPWLYDSIDTGREYWNRVLQDSGSPVRVEPAYGIPLILADIVTAGVPAQYTNVDGPERIEIDPEFFDDGWDPLVWDHLVTHEVGHYLGFLHGSCGQTDTVMYSPVFVPNPGQPTNTGLYLGRFSATTNNDRCYVYGEYRP